MTTTDTSEAGLESLIVAALTGKRQKPQNAGASGGGFVKEPIAEYPSLGYVEGSPKDYDRDHAVDIAKLFEFLKSTQPNIVEQLDIAFEGPKRLQFLNRIQGEISRNGIVNVLRKGFSHGPASGIRLFYESPSPGNPTALQMFEKNIFSVTRQLRYSNDETKLALDLVIFINGLPIATFELKNSLTKQTVSDAITQYQRDRDPRELLFEFGRCVVHFAVDDQEVRFCTHLQGKSSWFLPFNKGHNDAAGNPPNPQGLKIEYLWKEILERRSLSDILENFAQIIEEKDEQGRKTRKQIFPRYHQFRAVRKLLADASTKGVGSKYLVQHSAGSGKSNTIAWLALQLVGLRLPSVTGVASTQPLFDSIIVINDRTQLDKQIRETIKAFNQRDALVGHSDDSAALRKYIHEGKKIIVTTLQKFPFVLGELGNSHRERKYAIIIDEAHSSQGGRTAAKMNIALSERSSEEEWSEDVESRTEKILKEIIEQRRLISNASYFAFTATPKGRTLELFGNELADGRFRAFDTYTMKQAIQEGFIMDVLLNYTPVESYWQLAKKIESDPTFDKKKAMKRLRYFAERNSLAIRKKSEIIVDHFSEQVIGARKIGGKARCMVVTSEISRAYEYFKAISSYLVEIKSPYKAIVAFSGEHQFDGRKVTEATLNGFPSSKIERTFRTDPYRLLIVANKFTTGFDEPLLHSMYVDKQLSGIQAVQTLSRLNRAHPQKYDTFILDFSNSSDTIEKAFQDYYRSTILSNSTDPDKLHILQSELDQLLVYDDDQIDTLVKRYLDGADRDQLDPILDVCVDTYTSSLDEEQQIAFKGKAKDFCRSYSFLSSILPYGHVRWEKLSIFLNFLVPKLPAPIEKDLSKGVLESVDMDSYRPEVRATLSLKLRDEDAEIKPAPDGAGHRKPEAELERLSNIIRSFNDQFGNIEWKDEDKIKQIIQDEIPKKVSEDRAYRNAIEHADKQNARVEHDKALQRVILDLLADQTELFKQYSDNSNFRRWLADSIFDLTYQPQKRAKGNKAWSDRVCNLVAKVLGSSDDTWLKIANGLIEYFLVNNDEPIMLSGIEQLAGKLAVSTDDVMVVLQVLAADDVGLLRRTVEKVNRIDGSREEVAPGELNQALTNLSNTSDLAGDAQSFVDQVVLGWKPNYSNAEGVANA